MQPAHSLPLPTTSRQVRRIQPFSSQQGTDFAWLCTAVSFPQNAPLVLRCKGAPFALRAHFWIGHLPLTVHCLCGLIHDSSSHFLHPCTLHEFRCRSCPIPLWHKGYSVITPSQLRNGHKWDMKCHMAKRMRHPCDLVTLSGHPSQSSRYFLLLHRLVQRNKLSQTN